MVQDQWPREPPRPTYYQYDRLPGDQPGDDGRYHETQDGRRPPISVGRALREQCNIPAQHYFVAAVLDDGTTQIFAGPNPIPPNTINSFFSMDRYLRWIQRQGSSAATSPLVGEPDFPFDDYHRSSIGADLGGRRYDRRRTQGADAFDDESVYKTRKKARTHTFRRDQDQADDEPQVQVVPSRRGIKIGNNKEVWDFCDQRFKNLQQTACKLIAKAWVKLVEPKKQSTHPYTGKEEKAPDWWPKPWGPNRDERVRHKEPDHLYKKERVYLLNHILRMIVEPNHKQHLDIQKLNLNVAKLEEATLEALSAFFADKEHPDNAKKKPFLKEIFKVARYEERYKNGEIDADTEVYVMADDKIPENYQSDDGDGPASKDEEEQDQIPAPSSVPPNLSPTKTTSQGMILTNTADQGPTGSLQGSSFMSNLPVRPPHYQSPLVPAELSGSQQSYVEGGSLSVNSQAPLQPPSAMSLQEPYPDPHGASRRQTMFASPTEYANPPGPALYQGWQQSTTAPSNSPMYAFTQQHQAPQQGPFVQQPAVPIAAAPPYLGQSFDGIHRATYDPNQSTMFRNNSVPPVTVPHTQAYPSYLPHDTRELHPVELKADPLLRGPMH
ncbi:hypothetical protein NKR23_g2420 [Pleurostoma richardsiae]|uniref:Subtelomeric hrmA-associated cluster protein AFUB-079030/YDR124W-like helical bundle domain-containing protein n=1 Tax=Pleurostoma richardsiae TaxID=41990 RepID=A0AA38VVH0_9PEZI|nr:hypothetical protein NKR23_g2420 [Pleurostoma richardsiae]